MRKTELGILIVDDDEDIATMIGDHLRATMAAETTEAEIVIRQACTARQGLDDFYARPAAVVLADLSLPDEDGLSMMRKMRAHAAPSILIITGQATLGKAVEAMRLGAMDMLIKPFDLRRVAEVVKQAIGEQLLRRRDEVRRRRLHELASRIVRERRELRRRVDLVCHDLVGAYRDLAAKFVEHADSSGDAE